MMNSSVRSAASSKSDRMFGGVPAKTLLVWPSTSVSWISNIEPGAQTAAQASWNVIVIAADCCRSDRLAS